MQGLSRGLQRMLCAVAGRRNAALAAGSWQQALSVVLQHMIWRNIRQACRSTGSWQRALPVALQPASADAHTEGDQQQM